jgi:hypothetical protein
VKPEATSLLARWGLQDVDLARVELSHRAG